jgi:hypothetical protein
MEDMYEEAGSVAESTTCLQPYQNDFCKIEPKFPHAVKSSVSTKTSDVKCGNVTNRQRRSRLFVIFFGTLLAMDQVGLGWALSCYVCGGATGRPCGEIRFSLSNHDVTRHALGKSYFVNMVW